MHHTVAFGRTSGAAVEALTAQTPLADPTVHIEGTFLYLGKYRGLQMIYVLGDGVNFAQLDSPSLRRICLLDVHPIDYAAEPTSRPPCTINNDSPLMLEQEEGLRALTDNDAAAANRSDTVLNLVEGPITPVRGEIFTVYAYNASTLTANAWTNGALTFSQSLPPGVYAIVGAMARSAGLQAFRFNLIGEAHRPGGIGGDTYDAEGADGQRMGGWGEWGRFDSSTPPSVEFLSISADTDQEVWIDLIKVG